MRHAITLSGFGMSADRSRSCPPFPHMFDFRAPFVAFVLLSLAYCSKDLSNANKTDDYSAFSE